MVIFKDAAGLLFFGIVKFPFTYSASQKDQTVDSSFKKRHQRNYFTCETGGHLNVKVIVICDKKILLKKILLKKRILMSV